jgi:hypothetical protein
MLKLTLIAIILLVCTNQIQSKSRPDHKPSVFGLGIEYTNPFYDYLLHNDITTIKQYEKGCSDTIRAFVPDQLKLEYCTDKFDSLTSQECKNRNSFTAYKFVPLLKPVYMYKFTVDVNTVLKQIDDLIYDQGKYYFNAVEFENAALNLHITLAKAVVNSMKCLEEQQEIGIYFNQLSRKIWSYMETNYNDIFTMCKNSINLDDPNYYKSTSNYICQQIDGTLQILASEPWLPNNVLTVYVDILADLIDSMSKEELNKLITDFYETHGDYETNLKIKDFGKMKCLDVVFWDNYFNNLFYQ